VFPLTEKKDNHGDDKVTEAIDKVLKKIFGHEATLLIYEYLENRYSIRQNEIVEKINVFAKGLEEFLKSGAYIIEMKILEDVYSNYGSTSRLEFEGSNNDFVSQMRMLTQKA
jgi:hypothetical protein